MRSALKPHRNLYARAREKIRAAGGMKTTKQALQEIIREAHQNARQVLEEMIAAEEDDGNRVTLMRWRSLSPAEVMQEIDRSIAGYLKEVAKTDPDFVLFRHDHHRSNPADFDLLLKQLRKKGLM